MRTLWWLVLAACGSAQTPVAPVPAPPASTTATTTNAAPPPVARPWPATRVDNLVETIHGSRIVDPYRWLEDEKSPEVQQWMKAQDAYARGVLDKTPHRAEIASRLAEMYQQESITVPVVRGGRQFYERKHPDQEKSIAYWRQGETGAEHVLLDPNRWSADGSTGLSDWWPSWDGKTVVYAVSEHHSDEAVLHIVDVASGKPQADVIEGAPFASPSWAPDNRGFYYTWFPPVAGDVTVASRPGAAEIRYHKLGTPGTSDAMVYPATHDPKLTLSAEVSRDGHWLLVTVEHGWNTTDVYFRDLRKPDTGWTTLVAGADGAFFASAWHDQFYVRSNQGAPRGRVYRVDPGQLDRASWREIVPQGADAIDLVQLVGGHLLISYLHNAVSTLEVRSLDGALVKQLELPIGSISAITGAPDQAAAYVGVSSFVQPKLVYRVAITGKASGLTEWARTQLPIDVSKIVTEQVTYTSKDGTKIPMFLLSKQGTPRDGTNPTLLNGYGGFNLARKPSFEIQTMAWIERGGVYAVANLRGGGEFGEDWHRAGMLDKKQNVFDDFAAAAEYLIAEKWTSPAHLGITGGSNGGLLVGALATQRPELFKVVACGVPLLDMLRYHLFGLGATWVPEYGSAEDAAQFKTLYAYSPYRVAVDAGKRAYPTVLFDSADHDDRVDPMHARKLAAVLQAAQTGDGDILLRIERNAGHGGADVMKQNIERGADRLGLFDQLLR